MTNGTSKRPAPAADRSVDGCRSVIAWLRRHPAATCLALALAVRALISIRTGPILSPDSHSYLAAAAAVRADPLTGSASFTSLPPLFPLILALVPDLRAALAVETFLAALVVLPVVAVARRFGDVAAWSAGLAAAGSPQLLPWTPYLLTDMLGLVLIGTAVERLSAGAAVAGGFATGLAFLTRAAAIPAVLPAVLGILALPGTRRRFATFLGALTLVIGLAVFRHYVATGELRPYQDAGLYQLWVGTMWNETGRGTLGVDALPPPAGVSAAERNEFYRSEVARAWSEQPLDQMGRSARKILWTWLPAYPDWSTAHKLATGTYLTALYTFAVMGLIATWNTLTARVLLGGVVFTTLTTAVTIIDFDARYRLPIEILLLPLAGAGFVTVLGWFPSKVRRPGKVRDRK